MPLGEANALITILTSDVGLVRARAQGIRRSGAKLAAALGTFAESEMILVRGRDGWRIAGAVLKENWFYRMKTESIRARAARVTHLLLRLIVGETNDQKTFSLIIGFFNALAILREEIHESVETLAVIRLLTMLGFDDRDIPGEVGSFTEPILDEVKRGRASYIARINRGITASGL